MKGIVLTLNPAVKKSLTIIGIIAMTVICFSPAVYAQPKDAAYSTLNKEILGLINEHRAEMGLKPLIMNDVIMAAAESHSRNMGAKKVPFGHQGFDARMNKLGKQLKPVDGFAENVAYGPTTAKEAVELWLNSPGHKRNIEGNYNLTGLGIAKGKDGELYYTEIFISKK
jgi:uncharacterized protein YkwD